MSRIVTESGRVQGCDLPNWTLEPARGALEKIAGDNTILPGQMGGSIDQCGECRLRRELVVSAAFDYAATFRKSKTPNVMRQRLRQRADIESWLNGGDALLSFADCAAAFRGMTPEDLRARILGLAGAKLSRHHRFFVPGRSGRKLRAA